MSTGKNYVIVQAGQTRVKMESSVAKVKITSSRKGMLLYSDTIPDILLSLYIHIICRMRQESMWEIKYV